MKIDAVVFDMDGLMLDTERMTYELTQESAAELGYEITLDTFKQVIGKNILDTNIYFKSVLGEEFDFFKVRDMNHSKFLAYIEKNGVPKKPGIDELLEYLQKSNIKCAVASSTSRASAENMLKKAGIFKYFSAAVFGDMVEHGKPAPDIFIKAAQTLGVKCENCICLEDSYNGIRAAHSAGMIGIMVPDMLPPTDEMRQKVFTVADDLFAVIDIIEKINCK